LLSSAGILLALQIQNFSLAGRRGFGRQRREGKHRLNNVGAKDQGRNAGIDHTNLALNGRTAGVNGTRSISSRSELFMRRLGLLHAASHSLDTLACDERDRAFLPLRFALQPGRKIGRQRNRDAFIHRAALRVGNRCPLY
jgi:hypothetical protein